MKGKGEVEVSSPKPKSPFGGFAVMGKKKQSSVGPEVTREHFHGSYATPVLKKEQPPQQVPTTAYDVQQEKMFRRTVDMHENKLDQTNYYSHQQQYPVYTMPTPSTHSMHMKQHHYQPYSTSSRNPESTFIQPLTRRQFTNFQMTSSPQQDIMPNYTVTPTNHYPPSPTYNTQAIINREDEKKLPSIRELFSTIPSDTESSHQMSSNTHFFDQRRQQDTTTRNFKQRYWYPTPGTQQPPSRDYYRPD